jgi:hypothetical protein
MTHMTGPQDILKNGAAGQFEVAAFLHESVCKHNRHRAECDRHPDRPRHQKWLAPDAVDEKRRDQARPDADGAADHIDQQGIAFGKAGGLPEHRSVIENNIDTDQLLEGRQSNADPDDGPDTVSGIHDVFQARAMTVARQRGVDLSQLRPGLVGAHQASQHGQGPVGFPAGHQETRAFGNEEQGEKEDDRRDELDPEHPTPRFETPPELVG